MKKRDFPVFGTLEYLSASDYIDPNIWKFSAEKKATDGTYWDIIKNKLTGEYRYTNLED